MAVDPQHLTNVIVSNDDTYTYFTFPGGLNGCDDLVIKIAGDLTVLLPEGGGAGGAGSGKYGETPSGLINGSNKDFTTAAGYVANTLMVYLNGLRQKRVDDYTETSSTTFQLVNAPPSGTTLTVDYMQPSPA